MTDPDRCGENERIRMTASRERDDDQQMLRVDEPPRRAERPSAPSQPEGKPHGRKVRAEDRDVLITLESRRAGEHCENELPARRMERAPFDVVQVRIDWSPNAATSAAPPRISAPMRALARDTPAFGGPVSAGRLHARAQPLQVRAPVYVEPRRDEREAETDRRARATVSPSTAGVLHGIAVKSSGAACRRPIR